MSENDLKKKSGVIYLAVFLFAVCLSLRAGGET